VASSFISASIVFCRQVDKYLAAAQQSFIGALKERFPAAITLEGFPAAAAA